MVESGVAAGTRNVPAVDLCAKILDPILDLRMPNLHALDHRGLLLGRQILEVEVLAGTNTKTGQLRADRHFIRCGRVELQGKAQILEEVGLHEVLVDLQEVDRRCYGRRGLLEIG
ncbi:hypothetical protein D9M68_774890 [compost metagenome]